MYSFPIISDILAHNGMLVKDAFDIKKLRISCKINLNPFFNKPYDEVLGAAQFTERTSISCQKLSNVVKSGQKLLKVVKSCQKLSKVVKSCYKLS